MMKRIFTILFISVLVQIGFSQETNLQKNSEISYKGKFHIGIQNFSLSEYPGAKVFSISPRLGYMLSEKDMIFADMKLILYSRLYDGNNQEFSLNYRRFFTQKAFRPFVQAGIGYGLNNYEVSHIIVDDGAEVNGDYMIYKLGAGVSYTYKRWSIETGLQLDYRQGESLVRFKPIVGVSFSF